MALISRTTSSFHISCNSFSSTLEELPGADFCNSSLVSIVLDFATSCLLATFPGWHEEQDAVTGSDVDVKPFPSRPVSQAALALSFVSAVFLLVSAFWQHFSSSAVATALEFTVFQVVGASVGSVAVGLIWTSFFLVAAVTAGLLMMILSIIVFDRMTDD